MKGRAVVIVSLIVLTSFAALAWNPIQRRSSAPFRWDTASAVVWNPDGGTLGKLSNAQLTTATLSLVGEEARALLGEQFTASIRVRLMGAATSARRGAVRAGTAVAIRSEARIRLRLGASQ